ncbi:MAG: NAD(P)-dependent alcohol dehydrogenase [Acidimicrobiia bacterium]
MRSENSTAKTEAVARSVPATMKAMVQEEYGRAAAVLEMREVPVPEIGGEEVLVKVHSSSVNAMEWHLMNGKPYIFRAAFGFSPRSPILGADISGTVVAVGTDVTRFETGDEVFGEIGAGAYAEYAKAVETHLAAKPKEVSFEEAAAVGVAGLTALQGLRDVIGLESGQKVLINGASGGVGTYATQVAKVLGAEVTAVCSTRNVDRARDLGADKVIDYSKEDFTKADERFDAIFDIPGNHPLRALKSLLAQGGVYVMVGGSKNNWVGPLPRVLWSKLSFAFGDKRTDNFVATINADDLATLGEWLASGAIRSVIETRYPLRGIAIPLDQQGKFHARGKTVVNVEGGF